jgi:glutamyl-tRNA reductase
MNILTLGLNHNTAPLSIREKVSFGPDEIGESIAQILSQLSGPDKGGVHEVAILSTCNRTEIYCAAEDVALAADSLQSFLAMQKTINEAELEEHLYKLTQEDAVRHAFRVASGLDSMVLGETQIVGQIKKAEKIAREAGSLGLYLNYLFQKTFAVAKEVRTATEIGAHSISMAAAAVRVANHIFGNLHSSNILYVGAGEMIELCAAHFGAQEPKSCTVANRTEARAAALAANIGGKPVKLADLPDILHEFDIVISCTASSLPIIGLGMVQSAIKKRRFKPMFIVDLAVPRDVEKEVDNLEDVYVYTVDDLGKVVQDGMRERKASVSQAEKLIDERLEEFHTWLQARNSVSRIRTLQERADHLRQMELEKAQKALARGESAENVLEALSKSLMNKLIHDSISTLRNVNHLPEDDYNKARTLLEDFYRYHGK